MPASGREWRNLPGTTKARASTTPLKMCGACQNCTRRFQGAGAEIAGHRFEIFFASFAVTFASFAVKPFLQPLTAKFAKVQPQKDAKAT